ncbi:nucleoporin Nup35-like [Glossina fuscipes]|uniref:Nucleoporin NUP53 n=1 Tax=Glossina fuscipes TaxID=7396 RepID=A0A9C6DVB1_9MUSC|nr:nucleoporin Nup35-like [Glossina fuscipes]XP_037893495.1 nucleoporin Nup35-like [Glossina fuscipes]
MEPMNLGSPGSPGSPANSPYLPSFFMGEPHTPTTSRNNTFSPNKAVGRSFGFTNSPGVASGTQDNSRSTPGQKTLFGGYQQTPTSGQNTSNYIGTPVQNLNPSVGPPVQDLFDSLRNERHQIETPLCTQQTNSQQFDRSCVGQRNINFALNQSMQQQLVNLNDSLLSSNTSRNLSRSSIMSPIMRGDSTGANAMNLNTSHALLQCEAQARYKEFWVTVYGFPSTAISTILQHFSQCGTIVDTVMPSQNGNWIHLKYSSRLECDKALNYNEKILANNIMIGVTQCKDKDLFDKENIFDNPVESAKVRPLAQASYKNTQKDTCGPNDISSVQKSTGIVDKALDLFFGW